MTAFEEASQIFQEYPCMNEKYYHNAELFFNDFLEEAHLDLQTLLRLCDGEYCCVAENGTMKVSFKSPPLPIFQIDLNATNLSELFYGAYIIGIAHDLISRNTDRNFLNIAKLNDELYEHFARLSKKESHEI